MTMGMKNGSVLSQVYIISFPQFAAVLGPTLGGILVDVMGNQYRWLWLFAAFFMAAALA